MKQYLKCLILAVLVGAIVTLPGAKTQSAQSSGVPSKAPEVLAKAESAVAAETPAPIVPAPQPVCGPADPAHVFELILAQGVPKTAAIQILGSWQSESHLDPCQNNGDGGLAHGLNSWHPGRRQDMPLELSAQVAWAIKTELPRDCKSCFDTIMSSDSSVYQIRQAIYDTTRWGVQGNRWLYADQFATIFR